MGLILRSSSLANSGNSITVKGSALEYIEGDGNFVYLLTNMSGSNISITGSTGVKGNLNVSGNVYFPSLDQSYEDRLITYNLSTGRIYHLLTSSINVTSASYAATSSYADILTLPFKNPLPSGKPTGSVALSGSGGTFVGMFVYNGTSWINVKS